MTYLAEERRMRIVEWANSEGRVDVQDAATRLDVAVETIRRDLDTLQRRGLMRRVHGGAITVNRFNREFSVAERREQNLDTKKRIANIAATHIPNDGTIFIDSGTTTELLAPHLRNRPQLTVVTNSLILASNIGDSTTPVIQLAGKIRPVTLSTVGDLTLKSLNSIYADISILGTNGIDSKSGFTTPDPEEAAVKRAMVENSKERIVVADHSKFGKSFTISFASANEIDRLITDLESPSQSIKAFEKLEIEVNIA